jgi:hypothetical protein
MRIEKSINLARISKSNGEASKRERLAAIEDQDAQVTHLDYLRAYLMLEIAEGNNYLAQNWFQSERDAAT